MVSQNQSLLANVILYCIYIILVEKKGREKKGGVSKVFSKTTLLHFFVGTLPLYRLVFNAILEIQEEKSFQKQFWILSDNFGSCKKAFKIFLNVFFSFLWPHLRCNFPSHLLESCRKHLILFLKYVRRWGPSNAFRRSLKEILMLQNCECNQCRYTVI